MEGEVIVWFWFWFEEEKVDGVGGIQDAWEAQVSSNETTIVGSERGTKARAALVPRWSKWIRAVEGEIVSFRFSSFQVGE